MPRGAVRRLVIAAPEKPPSVRPVRRAHRMSPDDLLVFGAVAHAGGIRTAAEALGIPKSTVSRQLQSLEKAAGGRLVNRTSRRFTLTELGQALLLQSQQLESVLRASETIAAHGAQVPTGVLRVAASPLIGEELLPEAIADYLAEYEGVKVVVESASDLYATRMASCLKGAYASPAYLAGRAPPLQPQELEGHRCVVVGGTGKERWGFVSGAAELVVPVAPVLRVDSYRLARSAALMGVGIVRLPQFYAEPYVSQAELVPVLERFSPRLTLYAVHAAGSPAPPKIRTFIARVKKAFAHKLP